LRGFASGAMVSQAERPVAPDSRVKRVLVVFKCIWTSIRRYPSDVLRKYFEQYFQRRFRSRPPAAVGADRYVWTTDRGSSTSTRTGGGPERKRYGAGDCGGGYCMARHPFTWQTELMDPSRSTALWGRTRSIFRRITRGAMSDVQHDHEPLSVPRPTRRRASRHRVNGASTRGRLRCSCGGAARPLAAVMYTSCIRRWSSKSPDRFAVDVEVADDTADPIRSTNRQHLFPSRKQFPPPRAASDPTGLPCGRAVPRPVAGGDPGDRGYLDLRVPSDPSR